MSVITIPGLVKSVKEYHAAALAEGFTSREAMELTAHYQRELILRDFLEDQAGGGEPWERK